VWETHQVHLFPPRYTPPPNRTCSAASRVQPPTAIGHLLAINLLTKTSQPTTRAQRQTPRSSPTCTANISTAAYCDNKEQRLRPYTLFSSPSLGHTLLCALYCCPPAAHLSHYMHTTMDTRGCGSCSMHYDVENGYGAANEPDGSFACSEAPG